MIQATTAAGPRIVVVGLSHHTAPVEWRERLAYPKHELSSALVELLEAAGASEGVLVSTCNRTELYFVESDDSDVAGVWQRWSRRLGRDAEALGYERRDREAVEHLLRVAAGLDSMVLGEAQIQGQVRDAWDACRDRAGAVMHRLFQTALAAAGRVRSETSVTRGAASVSSAAVTLARQIFGSLEGVRAMVLGAGDAADVALECLAAEGVRAAVVANRTYERACEIAERHGARPLRYEEAWATLVDVDLLLCSTAAPVPVVTPDRVRMAAAARRDRPLCILDIAMPRDVDPAVAKIDNVYLYDLDDLQAVVRESLERRLQELPAATRIVEAEAACFCAWLAGLSAVPALTELRTRMDDLRVRELAQALRRLGDLTPAQRAAVEQLSRALMNKFLHEPSVRLRAAAAEGRGLDTVASMRFLFALERADVAGDADDHPATMPRARRRHAAAGTTSDEHGEP